MIDIKPIYGILAVILVVGIMALISFWPKKEKPSSGSNGGGPVDDDPKPGKDE